MPRSKKNKKKHKENDSGSIKSEPCDNKEENDSGSIESEPCDNKEDLPLPDGWARMFSTRKNRHYYLNVPKRASQWEHPCQTPVNYTV